MTSDEVGKFWREQEEAISAKGWTPEQLLEELRKQIRELHQMHSSTPEKFIGDFHEQDLTEIQMLEAKYKQYKSESAGIFESSDYVDSLIHARFTGLSMNMSLQRKVMQPKAPTPTASSGCLVILASAGAAAAASTLIFLL